MPYPIAHPAAVIPLYRLMGRFGVPSALAIGSVVPDFWYLLPLVWHRANSHSAEGLILFCLPMGLAAYLAFHLVKTPLLGLFPQRLAGRLWAYTTEGLPKASLSAVVASLIAGSITHVIWDALTHVDDLDWWLRHASTLVGGSIVVLWCLGKLRAAVPVQPPFSMPEAARRRTVAVLLGIAFLAATWSALAVLPLLPFDYQAARLLARTAGIDAATAFAGALLAYGVAWKLWRSTRKVEN